MKKLVFLAVDSELIEIPIVKLPQIEFLIDLFQYRYVTVL